MGRDWTRCVSAETEKGSAAARESQASPARLGDPKSMGDSSRSLPATDSFRQSRPTSPMFIAAGICGPPGDQAWRGACHLPRSLCTGRDATERRDPCPAGPVTRRHCSATGHRAQAEQSVFRRGSSNTGDQLRGSPTVRDVSTAPSAASPCSTASPLSLRLSKCRYSGECGGSPERSSSRR